MKKQKKKYIRLIPEEQASKIEAADNKMDDSKFQMIQKEFVTSYHNMEFTKNVDE